MRVAVLNRIQWRKPVASAIMVWLLVGFGQGAGSRGTCLAVDAVDVPYEHFAEIEVTLSESLTPARLVTLPQAPGSHVRLLDAGKRATAQLAAHVVGDLIEQGHDVTVLRDFLLSRKETQTVDASFRSDKVIGDSNDTEYAISEWAWVHSDIVLSDAPSGAVVTCVDVHYEIQHPAVEELWVDLCDENQTRRRDLWFMRDRQEPDLCETVTGITAFRGEQANQLWKLRATDVRLGHVGTITSWWIKVYYEGPWDVGTHDDRDHPVVVADRVPFSGTTGGATGEMETRCGYRDALDVWHSYTATQTGPVTIRAHSDVFDTTLAVFDRWGVERACGDDDCEGTDSVVVMPMTTGMEYLIRVAGYDYETGEYSLTVTPHLTVLAAAPDHPDPADGTDVDRTEITLSWGDEPDSLDIAEEQQGAVRFDQTGRREPATIYGRDDRMEEYEVTDSRILAAGRATAVLIHESNLVDRGDGTFQLDAQSFAWWYQWLDPLETGHALCPDEPFQDQPSAGICTGVLVGSDWIATAGHCVECDRASDVAVVFDFVMADALTPTTILRADQVYWIDEVIASQVGCPDWGLVRLDRKVVGRTPLSLRRRGRVPDDQELLVIGHPWGIPRKYDVGAVVRENTEPTFFQANLDTYQGHSGSPVIHLDSMEVEGIVCRGMEEFVEDVASGCDRSLVCPDDGCPSGDGPQWEDVTRATTFGMMVPVYDVYLGTDPTGMVLAASDLVVTRFRPQGLKKDTTYYWQVVARNAYGRTEGPLWSFRTTLSPGYEPSLSQESAESISKTSESPIGD